MKTRVQRYIEIGKKLTMQFALEHTEEDKKLCAERIRLRNEMSVDELKSLEGNIPAREFAMAILPLIRAEEEISDEQVATVDDAIVVRRYNTGSEKLVASAKA